MDEIFRIKGEAEFGKLALEIFYMQAQRNDVYKNYIGKLNIEPARITEIRKIPFLPIELFKTNRIEVRRGKTEDGRTKSFLSSGTTGTNQSRHFVSDISVYEKSFSKGFGFFYGDIKEYCLLALLPSYLENDQSSLVYMANGLITQSGNPDSGFFLDNFKELSEKLLLLEERKQKTLLLGVSYALLDFAEQYRSQLTHTTIMETGGMKGRRKELVREDLHRQLCGAFGVNEIHSEYGMTELLSQAYSSGNGIFKCPPWMKVIVRDTNDFFEYPENGQTGGINVIDLANINSCSFIATQDLGRVFSDGSFEVLGRFDSSDVRGCNLLLG